jgi:hypothetical protein
MLSHILRSLLTDCIPIGYNSGRRTDSVAIVQNPLKSSRTCHRHVTLTQNSRQPWLPLHCSLTEEGNATFLKDTSKKQSGTQTDTWEQAITPPTLIAIQGDSPLLISISKLYSGESQNKSKDDIGSPDQRISNTDSESLTRKGLIEAGGAPLTESTTKRRNHLPPHSDSEVKEETPQTQIQLSLLATSNNMPLLHWLNSFPTHITRPTIPSISGLPSLASRMSQIASTTTITPTSVLAPSSWSWNTRRRNSVSKHNSKHSRRRRKTWWKTSWRNRTTIGPPLGPPGGGPDENPDTGGGGDPGNPGGGGDPGNPGGGGDPGQPLDNPENRLTDKLIGREPEIFDGDRTKVEGFMTEWNVYRALNDRTRVMATPLERTMLFLTFIRGPQCRKLGQ